MYGPCPARGEYVRTVVLYDTVRVMCVAFFSTETHTGANVALVRKSHLLPGTCVTITSSVLQVDYHIAHYVG